MAKEIERKFLVKDNSYAKLAIAVFPIRQAYISSVPEATVRIRVSGRQAWITVKGVNHGAERDEWEYPVPVADAEEMAAALAGGWAIDKTRHIVEFEGWKWEIDEFHGPLSGLTVAEIELPEKGAIPPLPPFVGREVTGDPRYYNSVLANSSLVEIPLD